MNVEIIAEIGHNHNGNIRLAKEMITEAAQCGADVVKFQYYRIETIKKPYQSRYFELWASQLYKEDIPELYDTARVNGVEFMCSVFSPDLVADVVPYSKRFKIASRSIYDDGLWEEMQQHPHGIIASLGKWEGKELPPYEADYLYCVSDYPAHINDEYFPKHFFSKHAGFSDHTIGLKWSKIAIDRGARIIEKHFTLNRDLPGYNQAGSMTPAELKELVKYAKNEVHI